MLPPAVYDKYAQSLMQQAMLLFCRLGNVLPDCFKEVTTLRRQQVHKYVHTHLNHALQNRDFYTTRDSLFAAFFPTWCVIWYLDYLFYPNHQNLISSIVENLYEAYAAQDLEPPDLEAELHQIYFDYLWNGDDNVAT